MKTRGGARPGSGRKPTPISESRAITLWNEGASKKEIAKRFGVDYQGGTQYANLESEISNFHINNIMNGLAPSMLINFNNGQPPAEVKDTIEAQIKQKFGGSSNAGRFIISWNDSTETKADITPVQLSDAHNQYTFLSGEAMQKIMVSHRVVSPMLLLMVALRSDFMDMFA